MALTIRAPRGRWPITHPAFAAVDASRDHDASAPARHHHLPELQSVRGLAALMVVLHHCSFSFIDGGNFHYIVEAAFNAHAAVILFFVLSGYVLTRSLIGKRLNVVTVASFYVMRIFRIYPALWAALGLLLIYNRLGLFDIHPGGTSEWFRGMTGFPLWKRYIAPAALGFDNRVLAPLWTIAVELQASVLLPLIALVVRRGILAWIALEIGFVAMAWFGWPLSNEIWVSAVTGYLAAFGAGAGICLFASRLADMPVAMARLVAAAAMITMLFFRLTSPEWRFFVHYDAVVPGLVEVFSGAIVLAIIAGRPMAFGMLRNRWLVRLGDISFSLYLLHWVVANTLVKLTLNAFPSLARNAPEAATLLLVVGALIITIPLATLTYEYIERRGITYGRLLLGKLKQGSA